MGSLLRAPDRLFLWFTFLSSAALLVAGAVGVCGQERETAVFTPYLMLVLSLPMAALWAWLRTRERGAERPYLSEATISFRRRFRALLALGGLWLVILLAVVLHFHVVLGQPLTAVSLSALLGHLLMGYVVWTLLRRTSRRTRFLDDPTITLDSGGRAGSRMTAFVAQPVRRPVGLTKWEIALVCEKTRRSFLSRSKLLVHEDRREVVAGRVAHPGEILHGGGAFELPAAGPPSSPPGRALPRVDWHLESTLSLEGVGTFVSRFQVPVEAAER